MNVLFVSLALALFIAPFPGHAESCADVSSSRPIVGAIRWDAWHGDASDVGLIVEKTLAPKHWHHRLPFFGRVVDENAVEARGHTQEVMDRELEYAHAAGLDYWAFVVYPEEHALSLGLLNYLSSAKRSLLNFCLNLQGGWESRGGVNGWPEKAARYVGCFAEPGYQTVLDGRPLVFLYSIDDLVGPGRFETWEEARSAFDLLRRETLAAGLKTPYIVAQGWSPETLKAQAETLGLDAIGAYASSAGAKEGSWADLAAHTEGWWDAFRATGMPVVPLATAGWDMRPRVETPVPWVEGGAMDQYYEAPTPDELAAHVEQALRWCRDYPDAAESGAILIYAWNEFDEGGWLCPTLGEGDGRIRALGKLLRRPSATDEFPETPVYLDDLLDQLTITQEWGRTGVNTAAYAPGTEPLPLRIKDAPFERGLGHHANGDITVPLNGGYLAFEVVAGVQWQGGGLGFVVFEVWVDGERRFSTWTLSDDDKGVPLYLDVSGASTLRLVALDGGDGIGHDMAVWAGARLTPDLRVPLTGTPTFFTGCASRRGELEMEGSYALTGAPLSTQIAFSRPLNFATFAVAAGDAAGVSFPLMRVSYPYRVEAALEFRSDAPASVVLSNATSAATLDVASKGRHALSLTCDAPTQTDELRLSVKAEGADVLVRLSSMHLVSDGASMALDFLSGAVSDAPPPTPQEIPHHPLLEAELVEWDWRMQDGIGVGVVQNTFHQAASLSFSRGDALIAARRRQETPPPDELLQDWTALRARSRALNPEDDWEEIWRQARMLRRRLLLDHPLAQTGPLVFVKHAPAVFSHQLTQYYGRYARPGGGVYVLDAPGTGMNARRLGNDYFPQGSFMQPEVSHDGKRILVAFAALDTTPEDTIHGILDRRYHIHEIAADDTGAKRLTEGDFDDFSPLELPNGEIMFISTRRGGWHRCGYPGCEVYTLTLMRPDGSNIRTVSWHETQEWDPAVLNDGRVIYTRWDYVDRDAVHYQHLWTVRPDGAAPAAYYGNNTLNPVGIWEARAVPGSTKIMATAAAHHAMTAGSIVLVDTSAGMENLEPLTRLTPHAPFPESEAVLPPHWRTAIAFQSPETSPEMERWPGQCYRSPYPLSEDLFLAAYSFDPLIGEPKGNLANMFGLYLVDSSGNKELLYRDLNISSVWPVPLRPREPAPALPTLLDENTHPEGTYYLQNVYISDPALPDEKVDRLRIVQVLPKSTPVANNPTLGAPNASPGKQVLGTVPVEEDGSAYFRAPSGVSLSFQALDEQGRALQIMRSITYLQPGENASCVGCHESRHSAPPALITKSLALERPPSDIEPAPDGALPLSYPLLVQPVLDRHCVKCHGEERAEGPENAPVRLGGHPEGRYTQSYNALVNLVSYAAWGRGPFPEGNSEPVTQPDFFGARGSRLTRMLTDGHNDVQLEAEDWERLITWMDANALFYGTFNVEDQERQQRGERIAGPDLE